MRTYTIAVLCGAWLMLTGGLAMAQQPPAAALSEMQTLRADNFKLRVQVAQLQAEIADRDAKLANANLTQESQALAADFIKTAGGKDGDTWDWASMSLKKAPTPTAEAPAPERKDESK